MKHLITGVAAIALMAAAAHGQGNSQGKGNDGDRGKPEQAQSMKGPDNKGGKLEQGNQAKADRGQGNAKQVARGNDGNRGQGNADRKDVAKAASGQGNAQRKDMAKADAGEKNRGNSAARADRDNDDRRVARRDDDERGIRVLDDGRRIFERPRDRDEFAFLETRRGLIDGCPPGLAKKNNGCLPPGQAKQQNNRFANLTPDWWGLRGLGDGRYLYDDGYLMRLNGDRVAGFIPLLGGALATGNPWPSFYDPVPVPDYYVDYYDLGPSGGYRYADNVLYRVDPQTSVITSIAALLTGNPINIGAPMPAGYDVYNVPYPYRSQYVDGPNAAYRYNDGYIYEVDPTTQLVRAAIELIAG